MIEVWTNIFQLIINERYFSILVKNCQKITFASLTHQSLNNLPFLVLQLSSMMPLFEFHSRVEHLERFSIIEPFLLVLTQTIRNYFSFSIYIKDILISQHQSWLRQYLSIRMIHKNLFKSGCTYYRHVTVAIQDQNLFLLFDQAHADYRKDHDSLLICYFFEKFIELIHVSVRTSKVERNGIRGATYSSYINSVIEFAIYKLFVK